MYDCVWHSQDPLGPLGAETFRQLWIDGFTIHSRSLRPESCVPTRRTRFADHARINENQVIAARRYRCTVTGVLCVYVTRSTCARSEPVGVELSSFSSGVAF